VKNRKWEVPLIIPKATAERLHLNELDLPKQISAATITEWLERSQEGPLGGRLMKSLEFWQRLLPGSKWTEEWKAEGGITYPVQDLGPQEPGLKPRMDRMSEEERIQTMTKISEMEAKGVLEEVSPNAATKLWHTKARCWVHEVLNGSFTQEKKDTSKRRLLTDLKRSGGNLRMKAAKFKQDGPNTVKRDALADDETIALDLSDAYFQVPVAKTLRLLLRTLVWWRRNRRLRRGGQRARVHRAWYLRKLQYTTLSQGQTNAPLLFTKLLQQVLRVLAECGIRTQHKIDDVLVSSNVPLTMKSTEAERERYRLCLTHSLITVITMVRCGFLFNVKKCEVEPESLRTWHGFRWCFHCMMCGAPEDKIEKVQRVMREMRTHYLLQTKEPFTLKLLSKAIGTAMYLVEAANGTRSMLADQQELRLAIMSRKGWKWTKPVNLKQIPMRLLLAAARECLMWLRPQRSWNWRSFKKHDRWLAIVRTDASGYGIGAHITVTRTPQSKPVEEKVGRPLTTTEAAMHITKTETRASTEYTISTILRWDLHDGAILQITDATTTRKYINHFGGRKHWYTREVMQLQRVCRPRNLEICCEWTPGELNVEPDYQSRKVQLDEYSLRRAIYCRLQRLWCSEGKRFTVDWFAGKWNKQSRRYCTFDKSDRQALAVDAFTQNWEKVRLGSLTYVGTSYAFPPMSNRACGRMANQIISQRVSSIVIVVPLWRQGWLTSLLPYLTDWPRLLPCSLRPLKPPFAYSTADLVLPRYWTFPTHQCLITMHLSASIESSERTSFRAHASRMVRQATRSQLEERLVGIMLDDGDGSPRHVWGSMGASQWILTTLQSALY
jgi:hypothetical protein